jgi:hypothetical protein
MEHAHPIAEDIGQGEGVAQLLSKVQCLLASLQGLFRIAKTPQATGIIRQRAQACVRSTEGDEGLVMLLGFIEGSYLLEVGLGSRVFSKTSATCSGSSAL